jgi:hypothetical protein
MRQGALSNLAQYSAPLRRFGAWLPARFLVVAVGIVAMTALTVPELRADAGFWLRVCLWCCLGFFATDGALRLQAAWAAGHARAHALSLSGFVDLLGVAPVPMALAFGMAQDDAWLFCGCSSSGRIRPASPNSAVCSCWKQSRSRASWRCF